METPWSESGDTGAVTWDNGDNGCAMGGADQVTHCGLITIFIQILLLCLFNGTQGAAMPRKMMYAAPRIREFLKCNPPNTNV